MNYHYRPIAMRPRSAAFKTYVARKLVTRQFPMIESLIKFGLARQEVTRWCASYRMWGQVIPFV